ncbi:MAG: MarR family winged helix-turn-helix transcriptional regulator [Opitutaceae bacterium]|nr:MarR family winged helix-turn-helix transcriptional regulator [Opitutaceae bacterium]
MVFHLPNANPGSPAAANASHQSLLTRTLLTMARQRPGLTESRCRTLLEFLAADTAVRTKIRHRLAADRLSPVKFQILLSLYAIDPLPASLSDLALHAGISPSSASAAITELVRRHLLISRRDPINRHSFSIHLTLTGRKMADQAALHFLHLLEEIARLLPTPLQADLQRGCILLQEGAVG